MDFNIEQLKIDDGYIKNKFSSRKGDEWIEGSTSILFLNKNFGHLNTAEEMKNATDSEGLKLYFDWLKEKGILN